MNKLHPDSKVIYTLGGTGAVAKLCRVKSPSVSKWHKSGIPNARKMYLQAIRPDAFLPARKKPKK